MQLLPQLAEPHTQQHALICAAVISRPLLLLQTSKQTCKQACSAQLLLVMCGTKALQCIKLHFQKIPLLHAALMNV